MVADDPALPESWSATENVAWKTVIPGRERSSPIVWGDRVFVKTGPAAILFAEVDGPDSVWYSPATRCRRLIIFELIADILLTAGPVQAGPLPLAAATPQLTGCQTAAHNGVTEARQRGRRAMWIAGGVVLPIITAILAHVIPPRPPADRMLAYSSDDARCYAASFTEIAQRRRKTSAWIGSAAGVGVAVTPILALSGTSQETNL